MTITGAQTKAARELLQLSRPAMAVIIECGTAAVADFENGLPSITPDVLKDLKYALEAAGVEFIAENGGSAGVRLRKMPKGQ